MLKDLAQASLELRASGSKSSMTIAALPTLSVYWLMPIITDFMHANPDHLVNVNTCLSPFNFRDNKFDCAIHFGQKDWQGAAYLHLFADRVIPVMAPILRASPFEAARDLLELPLLHLESRAGAWENWFASHGIKVDRLRGMLFDQFSSLAEAAALGNGVALLPDFVADELIKDGRVIPAIDEYQASNQAYYLVWPADKPPSKTLDLFITHISQVIG